MLDLDSGEFLENTTYGLAVLDSNSQKTPATIDAGSCDVTNGCLNVSVVGRGDNFFLRENGTKSGLNQTLQQADFTLLNPSSCLLYDRDTFGYDFYYAYAAAYYGCPDLDCANKTQVVNSATYFNDYYLDTQRDYVNTREAQFQAGNATCLQNLDAGICTNDVGAPVFIDDDTLVGIVLSNLCEFEGEYGVKPVSVTFTQAIIGAIETELQSISGADCKFNHFHFSTAIGNFLCKSDKTATGFCGKLHWNVITNCNDHILHWCPRDFDRAKRLHTYEPVTCSKQTFTLCSPHESSANSLSLRSLFFHKHLQNLLMHST